MFGIPIKKFMIFNKKIDNIS